jgi:hypothetical protein
VVVSSAGGGAAGIIAPGTSSNLYGTFHVGGTISFQAGSDLSFNLSGSSAGELIIGGAASIASGADLTLNIGSSLTGSSYVLATAASGLNSSTPFTVTGLPSGYQLVYTGTALDLNQIVSTTSTTYTLTTSAASTLLHTGATTTLTTTITNTGGSSADTLAYSGLGASSSLGNGIAPGATTGGPVANNGGTATNSQTYTATTAGTDTISANGSGTNATIGGSASQTSATGTTINVYSGQSTWAGTGSSGAWGTSPSDTNFGVNWGANQGSPGVTAGFTGVDTATFVNNGKSAVQVNLAGANPNVNAINFNASSTSYTIGGGSDTGTLTLSGTTPSITVTNGTHTIAAPVVLGANTSVAVSSAQKLVLSGQISGGSSLTNSGAGTTVLSYASGNTYTGGTSITAGTVYASNTSGSATGTGSVTVSNTGSTLAGTGSVSGAVSLGSGAKLYSGGVATGTPVVSGNTSLTTTGLTLGSTLAVNSANLTFALGTDTTSSGVAYDFANPSFNSTYAKVSGVISFTGTDSISLVDLTSANTLSLRTGSAYVLITDSLGNAGFSGLVTAQGSGPNTTYSLDGNGYVVGVAGAGWVPADGATDLTTIAINQYGADGTTPLAGSQVYAAPVLYLENGDLEVVPEPGTWALMLGGLALLILVQRRRSKLD